MKVKTMIFRKGLFTRLDRESMGVTAHNYEYVYLWRKVLDEMLIGLISGHTSAVEHSQRWFNSKPGDTDYYLEEVYNPDTGEVYCREVQVDAREEFEEACSLASLDPELVTNVANKVFERAQNER